MISVNKESVLIVILVKFARLMLISNDMKIYHKFLLYQNKLLKPYVRTLVTTGGKHSPIWHLMYADCGSGI